MPKPRRTAEEVCIEYASRIAEQRRLKSYLNDRKNFCEHYAPSEKADSATNYPGYEGVSRNHCLQQYDALDPLPDGGLPSEQSTFLENEMCAACKLRLDVRGTLWMAKQAVTAAKRSVEAIGKRLNVAVPA